MRRLHSTQGDKAGEEGKGVEVRGREAEGREVAWAQALDLTMFYFIYMRVLLARM